MPGQQGVRGGRAVALLLVLAAAAGLAVLLPRVASAPAGGPVLDGLPAAAEDAPTVVFVGDSWTVGRGATDLQGYAVRTAAALGWHARVLGAGGSGYSVPGPHDDLFAERLELAVEGAPEWIVVQGSLNERRSRPGVLAPAARTTLAALRDLADPATRILVVGAADNPGTPEATIDWINRAVRAAADDAGLPFLDPAAEDWLDAGDRHLWSDSIHPSDLGHQLFADRLAGALRGLVGA
ncbi:SGNH/GDSL hydrolase family protein [Geodermatophilus sp. SYSU D00815]